MAGTAEHFGGRALLHDAAEIEDDDPVAEVASSRQVMADEEHGKAELLLQRGKKLQHLRLDGHIERRDGLVGDDEIRLRRERPGDADPLTLPA